MAKLIPIVDLRSEAIALHICKISPSVIVVRLQDLLTTKLNLTKKANLIKQAGGLRQYLNYEGKIILSFIARDSIIENLTDYDYQDMIEAIKPDYVTTIDCPTYIGKDTEAEVQMSIASKRSLQLVSANPNITFIGLIKGSNLSQIRKNAIFYQKNNITHMAFHVGDYHRKGNKSMMSLALSASAEVRKRCDVFYAIGVGNQKKFTQYLFSDFLVNNTFFYNATKGLEVMGSQRIRSKMKFSPQLVVKNLFEQMLSLYKISKEQTKLGGEMIWEEESKVQEVAQQVIPNETIHSN